MAGSEPSAQETISYGVVWRRHGFLLAAYLLTLLAYHTAQRTVGTFEGPDWKFGYEIGHVARSISLGEGFAYRIRGVHGTVPSVQLHPKRGDEFRALAIHGEDPNARPSERPDALPVSWASPVYTLVLAGILELFGGPTRAAGLFAIALNCVVQGGALLLFTGLAHRLLGAYGGMIAAALFFLDPSALLYTGFIWSQAFYGLGVVGLLVALFHPPAKPLHADLLFGGVAGALLLVDSSALLLLVVLFPARGVSGPRSGIRPQLAAGAFALLCLAPWALRNGLVLGVPTPLKNTTGIVFHMGNSPNAQRSEYYNGLQANPYWNADEMVRYASLGEAAYNRDALSRAISFVSEDPDRFLTACIDRATIFWLGRRGLEWTHEDLEASGFRPFRPAKPGEVGHRLWRAAFLVLAPIGFLLGVRDRSTRAAFLTLGAVLLVFPLLYYATIVVDRYRSPIDPLMCLLVARAIAVLLQRPLAALHAARARG